MKAQKQVEAGGGCALREVAEAMRPVSTVMEALIMMMVLLHQQKVQSAQQCGSILNKINVFIDADPEAYCAAIRLRQNNRSV